MSDQLIAESAAEVIIRALLASIDLTEWVSTLTDNSQYQACSKDHYAGATTLTPVGKRMSLNVERVGNLMVQHYVAGVADNATSVSCRSPTRSAQTSAAA